MPRLAPNQAPKLRHHKGSGLGVVTLGGKDHYCGSFGSEECQAKYNRLIAEWWSHGRRMPMRSGAVTMGELARAWHAWAAERYVKRGRPTATVSLARRLERSIAGLYGDTPAREFGPTQLRALRESWRRPSPGHKGAGRSTAARYQWGVKAMVEWGVGREMVPPDVLARLQAVEGPSVRDGFRDGPGTGPVPGPVVAATLAAMKPGGKAAALVRLLDFTGMRPGEACAIRPVDLDMGGPGDVWIYTVAPEWNKKAHEGRARPVPIGPRAQALLAPWLAAAGDPARYAFSSTGGRTPYRAGSLWLAVRAACVRAGVPTWHPNCLRHTMLTRTRLSHGVDAAQAIAGHSRADTTNHYSRQMDELARRVARETG